MNTSEYVVNRVTGAEATRTNNADGSQDVLPLIGSTGIIHFPDATSAPAREWMPMKVAVPGGDLSTIHNGRRWETIFFSKLDRNWEIHDVNGPEAAAAFAAKLNSLSPEAARITLAAYSSID